MVKTLCEGYLQGYGGGDRGALKLTRIAVPQEIGNPDIRGICSFLLSVVSLSIQLMCAASGVLANSARVVLHLFATFALSSL